MLLECYTMHNIHGYIMIYDIYIYIYVCVCVSVHRRELINIE